MRLSNDGVDWYEVSDEKFAQLLDNPEADCWVDISSWYEDVRTLHVTLKMLRQVRENSQKLAIDALWYGKAEVELTRPTMPATLYGIPVVYEDEKR